MTTAPLVRSLGATRAEVVVRLHEVGSATVSELAGHLDISTAATRKQVDLLAADGLVEGHRVVDGPGRPPLRWELTDAGRELFPRRYDDVASELLEFVTAREGRSGLHEFLAWRQRRQAAAYAGVVDADDLPGRVRQLAAALSADGYDADVEPDGDGFVLRQTNCTIERVARGEPRLCTTEAAAFARVLGQDVVVRREAAIATGDHVCVCHVAPSAE